MELRGHEGDPTNLIRLGPAEGGALKVLEREDALPEWGIDPVPVEKQVLSGFDLALLWGDLGIGLLVLVTGALLVPALGFGAAVLAIAIGSIIGVSLLALGARAGAAHGVPTMVLFRPILGVRGSWIPSGLNAFQLIGWTGVELWAMSYVADLVSQRIFGFSARWLWLAIAAVVCSWLALWGPIGVTRIWMKRFGAWAVAGICAVVSVLALSRGGLMEAIRAPGAGGWPTFGPALDLVIAMPVSWLPLVADYTRFATSPKAAARGTFFGYLIANVWLYTLGCILVLGGGTSPDPAGIAAGILAIAGGSIAGILFLVGLLVGETDEAFADIYSTSMSLQNIWPRVSQRVFVIGCAAVATGLAGWLTMDRYEAFLFLMGSIFVPLFGILIAEYFLAPRRLSIEDIWRTDGRYSSRSGVRAAALVPWVAGFAVYHWIAPTGPAWWLRAVGGLFGSPLVERWPWLSASLPSFAVALALSWALNRYTDSTSSVSSSI